MTIWRWVTATVPAVLTLRRSPLQKEEAAQDRKRQNELEKTEKRISELEAKIKDIETEMCKPDVSCNVGRLSELSKEQTACRTELDGLYEKWEKLSEA